MNNKQKIFIIIVILAIIVISFMSGLLIGQKNAPRNDLAVSKVCSQTFYAKIERIEQYNDDSFHINVKGLDINDINYRGNFTLRIGNNIDITWRGEKVEVSDLNIGNNISITFVDEIIKSISPTPLEKVIKIQILDDKIKAEITTNKLIATDIQTTEVNNKYNLSQEEIYVFLNIIDNLTFSKETCDGMATYYIKYESDGKNSPITYGIETFGDEYHITSNGNGEAVLSNEQKEQLDKIINKVYN